LNKYGAHYATRVTVYMGCDRFIIGNFTASKDKSIVILPWKLAGSSPDEVNFFFFFHLHNSSGRIRPSGLFSL
jgi:hypothetical protein